MITQHQIFGCSGCEFAIALEGGEEESSVQELEALAPELRRADLTVESNPRAHRYGSSEKYWNKSDCMGECQDRDTLVTLAEMATEMGINFKMARNLNGR